MLYEVITVGNDGDFGLEVDAPGLVGQRYVIVWSEKSIRTALVHQRVGPETGGHFRVPRLAHEFDVVDVGGAVGPLICTWQWGRAASFVESYNFV